jgi:tetratricopeptide (TPR) repeat protein
MEVFYIFRYIILIVILLFVFLSCERKTFDSTKNKLEMSTSSNIVPLTPLQQYRKLLKEKKYEDALPIVEAAMAEKAKILVTEHPEISQEQIRLQYLSAAYLIINLLLGRDEEALKKYEETISQLSEEQYNNGRHLIFVDRLLLFSRLNRIDDFISECNNLINRPSPDIMDYSLGYLHGALGYAMKNDYEKTEQYLSSAKPYFTVIFSNYNDNDETLMVYRKYFELCEIFLTCLQNEYDLKPAKAPPTITETSDGSLNIKTKFLIEAVSKKTGKSLMENEFNTIIKKWQKEKEQEQKNKLQDDPFLRELRTNSQETNSQNTLEK